MNTSSFWGSGWAFPPTFDKENRQLKMTHEIDNIKQSIDLLLHTQRGERSILPYWGADLNTYLFQNPSAILANEMSQSVKSALLHYEPRIRVDEVDVNFVDTAEPYAEIVIQFTIKKINSRHNHVYPFSLIEGTNLTAIPGKTN